MLSPRRGRLKVRNRIVQVILVIWAAVAVQLGMWATFAPRSFYDDYPGVGRHWVRVNGPYNEHFIRDFGALNLALAVVTITALVTFGRPLVIAVAVAWLAWGIPHLVYHLRHLDVYETEDKVLNVFGLAALPVFAVVVLALTITSVSRR
jgi:hypothetical protein